MTSLNAISYLFFGMFVLSLLCFLVLTWVYWKRGHRQEQRGRRREEGERQRHEDGVVVSPRDMMVAHHKKLAHQFHAEVDGKMAVVKELLSQSLQRNGELYAQQRALEQTLAAAEKRLTDIQMQLTSPTIVARKTDVSQEKIDQTEDSGNLAAREAEERAGEQEGGVDEGDADELVSKSKRRHKSGEDELFPVPEMPADPDGAREAFRALLDQDGT